MSTIQRRVNESPIKPRNLCGAVTGTSSVSSARGCCLTTERTHRALLLTKARDADRPRRIGDRLSIGQWRERGLTEAVDSDEQETLQKSINHPIADWPLCGRLSATSFLPFVATEVDVSADRRIGRKNLNEQQLHGEWMSRQIFISRRYLCWSTVQLGRTRRSRIQYCIEAPDFRRAEASFGLIDPELPSSSCRSGGLATVHRDLRGPTDSGSDLQILKVSDDER